MSDGNEERKEQEERRKWEEKRKGRDEDRPRDWEKDGAPERRDSRAVKSLDAAVRAESNAARAARLDRGPRRTARCLLEEAGPTTGTPAFSSRSPWLRSPYVSEMPFAQQSIA